MRVGSTARPGGAAMAPGVLPVPAPARRHGAWTWYLLLGLTASVLAVSAGGTARPLILNVVQLSGVFAILAGVRRRGAASASAWRLIALGSSLAILADCLWTAVPALRADSPLITAV